MNSQSLGLLKGPSCSCLTHSFQLASTVFDASAMPASACLVSLRIFLPTCVSDSSCVVTSSDCKLCRFDNAVCRSCCCAESAAERMLSTSTVKVVARTIVCPKFYELQLFLQHPRSDQVLLSPISVRKPCITDVIFEWTSDRATLVLDVLPAIYHSSSLNAASSTERAECRVAKYRDK